jgi:hypothetical protein
MDDRGDLPLIDINKTMCDHAEILLPILFGMCSVLFYLYLKELRKKEVRDTSWEERIEEKLDKVLEEHINCQKSLPFTYITKEEFRIFLDERNKQWDSFTNKFDQHMTRFWHHQHDNNGKVEAI